MIVRSIGAAVLVLSAALGAQAPTPRPDTEIFLAPLTTGSRPSIGAPVNVSNNPGYDNQPSFTPDGSAVLFTSVRGGEQSDIYRYDIGPGVVARVTSTPESEYSPAVTPDGQHISVIRVEADGTQRLWRFTVAGASPSLVLDRVKPVGYHAWIDSKTLVLFVLGEPPTLQVADASTGQARVAASGIGRSLHRIPGRSTASFVQRQPPLPGASQPSFTVMELDPATGSATRLATGVPGSTDGDVAWTPDGWLLMARGAALHGWKLGTAPEWQALGDLSAAGVKDITRIAVSPGGDRIAIVATR